MPTGSMTPRGGASGNERRLRFHPLRRAAEFRPPVLRFAAMAMLAQRGLDFRHCRFNDMMLGIGGQVWADGPREGPAGPGPPPPLITTRLVHAIGVMLEMHARIADKNARWRVGDQPRHRSIRQRMRAQDRFVARQFGSEGAIETKQRARGEPLLPQRMSVFEAGKIKFGSAILGAMGMQRAPVETGPRHRQMWTGRKHR